MSKWLKWTTLIYCVACLSTPGVVAQGKAQGEDSKTSKPAGATIATGGVAPNEYVIGAGDVVGITVWKEPEMSASNLTVRPDGRITLPLLNDLKASDLTAMQLGEQITEKLKKYLTDPHVTVTVVGLNSQRIFILGEVARPGAFPLLPSMTVLQALSTAGGLTQFADGKKAYVLRGTGDSKQKLPFNYKRVIKGENSEQNITLKPGDTVVIP